MRLQQKILILFNGPHLAYSPTVLQLYQALSKEYQVTVIAQNPKDYSGQKPNIENVIYHSYYQVKGRKLYNLAFGLLSYISPVVKLFKKSNLTYRDYYFKFLFIKNHLKVSNYDRIISVDLLNLFFCTLLHVKSDFQSLELLSDKQLLPLVKKELINCVLIQSSERYQHLFEGELLKVFYVQNAPIYQPVTIQQNRTGIIYTGAATDEFGFFHCLNFLVQHPEEKMTLQGAVLKSDRQIINTKYGDLVEKGALIINTNYLKDDELWRYLQLFEVGMCFYNFDNEVIKAKYFNYATAPSGKMFKYLAAGVPVVGSDIIGFRFVNEFKCGVLIKTLAPNEIMNAINLIRQDYKTYSANALKAAQFYSFDKAIQPYLDFIKNE